MQTPEMREAVCPEAGRARKTESELSLQDSARVPRAWKRNMRNQAEDTSDQWPKRIQRQQSDPSDPAQENSPLPTAKKPGSRPTCRKTSCYL